ncbi:sigma-54-dependent Fis family transcriptional regulator [Candidatus Poribacteria bacterium]|nr:sigma-54-dependent Fis family transcriptional regulator [Candidatus Poribacteria bacterium]
MSNETIIVIDDEIPQRETMSGFLNKLNFKVLVAASGKDGLDIAKKEPVDLILTDYRMPDKNGLEVLKEAKQLNPLIEVILITAYGSVEGAVDAMKAGAADYIEKPIDLDRLEIVIQKALERKKLTAENLHLRQMLEAKHRLTGIISASGAMEEVINIAGRAAVSKATILLRGASGTGKELLAQAIHYASPRSNKPFIAVNCAALNENLLESELFGHEKGAFTGADKMRRGRFELADGGTLFLDEVGDIPLAVQVKLLRVLQEQTFERLGGSETIKVNVRLIAATNRNLEELIEKGAFREDLFYRLNVVNIYIPPLRQRKEDIPPLVSHFIEKYAVENNEALDGISKEALDLLMRYNYPGNIRELENIIERAVVLTRGNMITKDDLPLHTRSGANEANQQEGNSLTEMVEHFEQKLIIEALDKAEGNQSQAAKSLGIGERKLRYKLKKYKIK